MRSALRGRFSFEAVSGTVTGSSGSLRFPNDGGSFFSFSISFELGRVLLLAKFESNGEHAGKCNCV